MLYMSICFLSITILTWDLNMAHLKRNRLWGRLKVGIWSHFNVKLWSFPRTQVWHHVWRQMCSGSLAPLILTGGRALRWLAVFTLRALYLRGKSLIFLLSMGMGGSQKRFGCLGEIFCLVHLHHIITNCKHSGFKTRVVVSFCDCRFTV